MKEIFIFFLGNVLLGIGLVQFFGPDPIIGYIALVAGTGFVLSSSQRDKNS